MSRAVVVGLAVTGRAVARRLTERGWDVDVVDDRPTDATRSAAVELGVELTEAPDPDRLDAMARRAELVVVSPGVPARHPVFSLGAPTPVVSEIELASTWTTAPLLAVTGTNGKTTVVTLVADMLRRSGRDAVAAGNSIGETLIDAVSVGAEAYVVEVSSFQLALTRTFRPRVAGWLNFAPDHLDWHPDLDDYRRAKARIWANQGPDDTAVVNVDDAVVRRTALEPGTAAPGRVVGFGILGGSGAADEEWPLGAAYRVSGEWLVGPDGEPMVERDALPRALPHDLANALAALAVARAGGADPVACRQALVEFEGLPHRVALVGDSGGVRFFDDSKATTPASVLAAMSGFDSMVLIAGGRNKGLDLSVLSSEASRVRAVVAIGEAAGEVEAAFAGLRPVETASSMREAVAKAAELARPGDAVVLSPGCASFDWYGSYAERGDDFARAVAELIGARR
ncbi:MAG TPA: UDP-N-acetylmuramoyl-L-alanine--D-glutamate ligase [Acidimicrobiales bacterium]|nr:UDP-N-acetylmuramoyl-L-alanine--D-glutamate ligase [Acidimicrobiales bacterium]